MFGYNCACVCIESLFDVSERDRVWLCVCTYAFVLDVYMCVYIGCVNVCVLDACRMGVCWMCVHACMCDVWVCAYVHLCV